MTVRVLSYAGCQVRFTTFSFPLAAEVKELPVEAEVHRPSMKLSNAPSSGQFDG
jgi:hypothetical protein